MYSTLEFNPIWLEVVMGRYFHVVQVRQWSVGSSTHLLTVQLLRGDGEQNQIRLLSVRYGSQSVIYCESIPLSALYSSVCPPALTDDQRVLWRILRHLFRHELQLVTNSFMSLLGTRYPPLQPHHLVWGRANGKMFSLVEREGVLVFLRKWAFESVSLTLVSVSSEHPFRALLEEVGAVTVRVHGGEFLHYKARTPEWRVATVLRNAFFKR